MWDDHLVLCSKWTQLVGWRSNTPLKTGWSILVVGWWPTAWRTTGATTRWMVTKNVTNGVTKYSGSHLVACWPAGGDILRSIELYSCFPINVFVRQDPSTLPLALQTPNYQPQYGSHHLLIIPCLILLCSSDAVLLFVNEYLYRIYWGAAYMKGRNFTVTARKLKPAFIAGVNLFVALMIPPLSATARCQKSLSAVLLHVSRFWAFCHAGRIWP